MGVRTAIVLCAGRGKRLRPYTDTTPKPLLPINGKPTLHYVLDALRLAGCERAVLVTHHLSEQIESYAVKQTLFASESICCVDQKTLNGTADAAVAALTARPEWFEETFLVTASDYIVPEEFYTELVNAQTRSQKKVVVSVKAVPEAELAKRSSVRFDDDGNVLEIVEKPEDGKAPSRFSANLVFILPPDIVPMIKRVEASARGEKEIQSAVNAYLAQNGVACAVEAPAPAEWQAPAD